MHIKIYKVIYTFLCLIHRGNVKIPFQNISPLTVSFSAILYTHCILIIKYIITVCIVHQK